MDALLFLRPFGVDVFCVSKKFLVFNLVGRNLKIKYRRSALGVLWTLLAPAAQIATFYFVFKVVMKIQVPHYLAFLVSGIIPWTFFSQTLAEGVESIVGNLSIVAKVPVPIQIFPFVGTVTNFVNLLIALPIVMGVSIFSGVNVGLHTLLLPFYLCALFFIGYSLSLIAGLAHVYVRDLRHLAGLVLQLWFYATPVLYNSDMIPEKYSWILLANPLGGCFVGLHKILGEGVVPPLSSIVATFLWTISTVIASILFFKAAARNAVENL